MNELLIKIVEVDKNAKKRGRHRLAHPLRFNLNTTISPGETVELFL